VRHPDFEAQVDAQLDGELDTFDARELEAHLAHCAECARFRDERLELRAAITARVPAFQAPDALRRRVQTAIDAAARERVRRHFGLRGFVVPLALAASLAVVAVGSWNLSLRRAAGETLADDVLASHIRSLMPPPGHLMDVASSDQHTVKPWFNGRLDFSPPVHDFAGQGYPLLGGRVDYVNGRAVAALVYGRRQHVVNVFVWPPATRGPSGASEARDRQGYHLLHWTTPDYAYWVVSDLGSAELNDFAQMLRQADSATTVTSRR
jgi:anti-sigma factor RsiW